MERDRLEDRLDRFETRVEREFADGARNFMRREVFDVFEREIRSDLNDLKADLKAFRAEQSDRYKTIRNLVLSALFSAIASGLVSLVVWRFTSSP